MNKKKFNEYRQGYRKSHKELGLCVDCAREAIPGLTRCIYCWSRTRLYYKRYYQANRERLIVVAQRRYGRYKRENRCPRCGAPLMDSDSITCVNCNMQKQYPNRNCIGGLLNEVNHKTASRKP